MSYLQKIIAFIIALGLILIGIFSFGLYPKNDSQPFDSAQGKPIETSQQSVTEETNEVKVVSTNLSQDDTAVISPSQPLEVTFNKPMVQDLARISIDPQVDHKVELSPDHKTIKIIPDKPLDLGKDYTLTIKSGYGTDTGEKLESDQVFHFRTIEYKGV